MSLSDSRVIALLNRSFVPVYIANEDYRDGGSAPREEKAELRRIHREGHAAKRSVGSVHAYVLDPDGRLVDSMHVVEAAKAGPLVAMLERTVQNLGVRPGDPLLPPKPQSEVQRRSGELTLHIVARYLERKGDGYALIENAGGNWSAFPGESRLSLSATDQAKLLPTGAARPGMKWTPDAAAAKAILTHFYPPTENNDLAKNRFEAAALEGTVDSVSNATARGRITGTFKMAHPFYHNEDGRSIEAGVVGTLEWDPATGRIRSFRMVTRDALYHRPQGRPEHFGVAVRSLP